MGKPVHKNMVHCFWNHDNYQITENQFYQGFANEIAEIVRLLAPLISYWKILEQNSKTEKAQTWQEAIALTAKSREWLILLQYIIQLQVIMAIASFRLIFLWVRIK